MTLWARIRSWLSAMLGRTRMESEMDAELRFHMEAYAEDLARGGVARQEAMRRARLEFGGIERAKEECREARGLSLLDSFLQDLRYALRVLRKSPGFAAIATLTLALGITANVTVFSFADALFLRSVPAKDPKRLVRILATEKGGEGFLSFPEYAFLRDHAKSLDQLAAHYSTAPFYVSINGQAGEIMGAVVSSNYFEMLGLRPSLGRFFLPEEDSVPDRDALAVIGYGLWQRIYGADPEVTGKSLSINGHRFQIIGVAPKEFGGVELGEARNEIWIPSMMSRVGYRWCDALQADCTIFALMGHLAPGNSPKQAQAELTTLTRQLQSAGKGFDEREGVSVTPAAGVNEREHAYFLLLTQLLSTVAGVLLLVVCANLAGLLVARNTARGSEIAMRRALGAGTGRISRQLLTENLLLAAGAGAISLILSLWTSKWLAGFWAVDDEGYRRLFDVRLDWREFAYAIAITLAAGALFSLLPLRNASRTDLNEALKSGGKGAGIQARSHARAMLVSLQVGLSLTLLVGAGLLFRSSARLEASENMDLHQVLGLRLRPRLVGYPPEKSQAFLKEVIEKLRAFPQVESVSLMNTSGLVWSKGTGMKLALPGKVYAKPADEETTRAHEVALNYFATLRIPFVAGRDFNQTDRPGSPRVVIVNETLASLVSKDRSPLGQYLILNDKPYEIVGEVKDAQIRTAVEGPVPMAYLPFWQSDTEPQTDARMCIRVSGNLIDALPQIRQLISEINPDVPITETMPLLEQVRGAHTNTRVAAAVMNCAALLAVVLCSMGLFGVVSYEVGRRGREIGIRMALGARPGQVVGLFLRQGVTLACIGCAGGLALSLATSHLLSAWLIGVRPVDPGVFSLSALLLASIALLASYLPAKKAARVDPVVVMRYE